MRPAMGGRFNHADAAEDSEYSPENSGGDSPRSDSKIVASTSSSRRRRRAVQKRVVSVPLRDVEGLRLKGDQMSAPPSDSWAWRKYGQKPIKGSPYPRGYYRCSSSKGCPARKQVERSKDDPDTLVVTYSCDHNHPSPAPASTSRNSQHMSASAAAAADVEEEEVSREDEKPAADPQPHEDSLPDYKFTSLGGEAPSEFEWFTDFESTAVTMLENPILTDDRIAAIDADMATIFAMREDDESLFAGLGELPECSTVFRRRMAEREAARRPPSLTTTT